MTSPIVVILTTLVLAFFLVHLLAPGSRVNTWASSLPGVAQLLAFPILLGGGIVILACLAGALCLRCRARWGVAASSLLIASGLIVAAAATPAGLPTLTQASLDPTDRSVVVAEWNAGDEFEATAARYLLHDLAADILVLPEFGDYRGTRPGTTRLQESVESAGLRWTDYDVFESPITSGDIGPVTVIVRQSFARYRSIPVPQTTFGTLHLVADGAPDIVALHTAPPLPGLMASWSRDLTLVARLAGTTAQNALIVGDFNATLRHGPLATVHSHADALLAGGSASGGTWHMRLPPLVRAAIDHILVPTTGWAVHEAEVLPLAGSDHAAVVVGLQRVTSA